MTLNIDSTGNSNDTVVIGAGGSLMGIQGTVNIANHSGQTSVIINDTLDGARIITVTDHSVDYAGLATINYDAGYLDMAGNKHGVTSLTVEEGAGSPIDVESVGALTNTSVYWEVGLEGFGRWFPGLLYGPAANKVHVIGGPVFV